MSNEAGLRFRVEWEEPGGVRSPELSATWCRLEVWVGDDCVSRVEEVETSAARRSIFVPLYPLAEWIAYNWWYLKGNLRPTGVPTAFWTYTTLVNQTEPKNDWLRHHNLRAVGEGFPWPDLTIVPEGNSSRILWRSGVSRSRAGLRYLSSGESTIPSNELQSHLAGVVELALTRLDEAGVINTSLRHEWDTIQQLDDDEVAFCEATARLGLDPFEVASELGPVLEQAGAKLSPELLRDFLDAVDPRSIAGSLAWIAEASVDIDKLAAPEEGDLKSLRSAIGKPPVASREPWVLGYAQARALRSALGVKSDDRFEIERFVSAHHRPAARREIYGYGVTSGGVRLIRTRTVAEVGERFTSARALWHGLCDYPDAAFLLTRARTTTQKIERAFAAELLAPARGVEALLRDAGSLWDSQDAEEVADHFGVRADVIQRQIENNIVF